MSAAGLILDARGKPMVRAFYEGAQSSKMRASTQGNIQSARRDLSRATRRELLRNSRAMWKNSPLVKAVFERFIIYTNGTGIRPEPISSNPEWNKRAAVVFEEWAKHADLSSRQSFWKLQEIALRSLLIDGDVFCILTYGDSGRPRIQLVEGDQCGSPTQQVKNRDDDGVVCDKNGRPVEYIFQESVDAFGSSYRERRISAENVVQLGNFNRPGQQRGEPMASAALTTAIDLHEILGMEKGAVKISGRLVDIIKTASGEVSTDGLVGQDEPSVLNGEEVTKFYQEVFGPETKVLRHGDDYVPNVPQRPSQAWAGFVDFLAELVCLTFNLPPSLVRQIKSGSVDNRRDLATIQRVAEQWQWTLAQQWQRVWEYVIQAEIEDGALADAPTDWKRTDWMFPKAPTVDAGRQQAQDRDDVRAGLMTEREYWGQFGIPWRVAQEQIADEAVYKRALEKSKGLPEGFLMNRSYGPPNTPPAYGVQPDPQATDKAETEKEAA